MLLDDKSTASGDQALLENCYFKDGSAIDAAGIDETLWNEGPGLLHGLFFFLPGPVAVELRWQADLFFEQDAEGADALKADIVADLRDGEVLIRQPETGLFHPLAGKVLVGCCAINAGEEPVEMKAGEAGLPGNAVQIDGLVKMAVHIDLGGDYFSVYVRVEGHLGPEFPLL